MRRTLSSLAFLVRRQTKNLESFEFELQINSKIHAPSAPMLELYIGAHNTHNEAEEAIKLPSRILCADT